MTKETFSLIMNALANGSRIAFAVVFLVSFAFRPVIKDFISRAWERVIEDKKPFFGFAFGIVGAIIAFIQAL